ncbi:MAG: colicin V synthesis protein [Stappia sp.]|uniref:CvpA family protein n=1 Tax=Stappia sp. TaxID=1870903 RepID=UPI000C4BE987|nr:CvpA family protein [Stappia sp.]MAA97653.1 colicin V synthesis protein [Stappia sp.]MBM20095.1 colicin V synthesis protein [Stappia sp.]
MPITLLDGILIVIMLLSAVLAMIRGFVREVLSIASWVIAAVAAFFLYGQVLPFVTPHINDDSVALGVSVAAVFLVTLIVVSYITMRISDFVLDSRIGALDRTLGFVFGALRGMLLVVVAMLFFNWFVPTPEQPQWIASAKSKPMLDAIGDKLVAALPENPEGTLMDRIRTLREKNGGGAPANASATPDTGENAGYTDRERQGLEQLTTSGSSAN